MVFGLISVFVLASESEEVSMVFISSSDAKKPLSEDGLEAEFDFLIDGRLCDVEGEFTFWILFG